MPRLGLSYLLLFGLLFCSQVSFGQSKDTLLEPYPDFPVFEISNLEIKLDGNTPRIEMDFKRTKPGDIAVTIRGRTASTYFATTVSSSDLAKDSGKLSFVPKPKDPEDLQDIVGGVEVWVAVRADWAGANKYCMLSNAITYGGLESVAKSRKLSGQEQRAFENHKKKLVPPENLPEGFSAVDANTKLLPGMRVKAGWNGEWADAEVIDLRASGDVLVKFFKVTKDLKVVLRNKWLAINPEVLAKSQEDPGSFSPSVFVLSEGTLPLPEGFVPVPDDVKLLPGAAVVFEIDGEWAKGMISEVTSENSATVKIADAGEVEQQRAQLAISKEVLEQLNEPGIEDRLANKLLVGETDMSQPMRDDVQVENFPIKARVPADSEVVTNEMQLEPGTTLAVSDGKRWYEVSVVETSGEDLVLVEAKKGEETKMVYVKREQLIIQTTTLKKLEAVSKAKALRAMRTWTDSTGTFKIKAKFVDYKSPQVALMTEDGKSIVLPIDKLSRDDQNAVRFVMRTPIRKVKTE